MTDGQLTEVNATTFAVEKVMERQHLQAALRQDIGVLGEDLLVVAEEYGDFLGANRRIDLLCLDKRCRLVVVELKRTEDGGHMELQALRYAAMVSVMTYDDLVQTYARSLNHWGETDAVDTDDGGARILEFLDEDPAEEPVISRDVRIVLASANFNQEVTTTVLWLNDMGLDVRCVRLSPYRMGDRLLLDIQQLIPLPEAEALTVKLRKRDAAVREKAAVSSNRDLTKYVVEVGEVSTGPVAKRQAILAAVAGAVEKLSVAPADVADAIGRRKLLRIDEHVEGDAIWPALVSEYDLSDHQRGRWFVGHPFYDHQGRTWVLSKMWGIQTEATLEAVRQLAGKGLSYRADEE